MATARSTKQTKKRRAPSPLTVRLDDQSKACLEQAAALRGISVSDYLREVAVAQARREVLAAREYTFVLTPDELLAFWTTINETPRLTDAQRRLGAVMRGET